MDQDWTPLVLRKTEQKGTKPNLPQNNKANKNLQSDDPDAPKVLGMSVGKQIQQARVKKGLSQADLAKQLNVRANVIKDYESGSAVPDRAVLNRINTLLGIKLNFSTKPVRKPENSE